MRRFHSWARGGEREVFIEDCHSSNKITTRNEEEEQEDDDDDDDDVNVDD